jgi:hypothetical protein
MIQYDQIRPNIPKHARLIPFDQSCTSSYCFVPFRSKSIQNRKVTSWGGCILHQVSETALALKKDDHRWRRDLPISSNFKTKQLKTILWQSKKESLK